MLSRSARLVLAATLSVAALAGVFYFFAVQFDTAIGKQCAALAATARDAQKMQYVREWLAKRTANEEFMDVVVKYRAFEQFSPFTPKYVDIDWRYLGFDPRAAWLGFNINDAEEGSDPARILSVSLNQSRAGIILKLRPTDDVVGRFGPPGNLNSVKPVSDDVFVYCDYED